MPGLSVFFALFILLFSTPAFAASAKQFSLGLGIDYARGDFHTDSTSTYTTYPLVFDWLPNERFNLELTVPFVKQTSSNTHSMGSGHMGSGTMGTGSNMATVKSATTSPSAMVTSQGMMGGAGNGVMLPSGENQSGVGDTTLAGAYNLLLDGEATPNLAVTGYLKFPTADKDKGLGTGAFDWGPGLLLSKRLGDWQPFTEGRYVLQGGSREEIGARNYFLADVGLGYIWKENLSNALFCRVGTRAFAGMAPPLEMRLKTVWGFSENTSAEFYLLKGLSDGSPDLGGGMSISVGF